MTQVNTMLLSPREDSDQPRHPIMRSPLSRVQMNTRMGPTVLQPVFLVPKLYINQTVI